MTQLDMFPQLDMFDMAQARAARDEGMRRVEAHANADEPAWAEYAYEFLLNFAHGCEEFKIEDVRAAAAGHVPDPPDARAWGPVAFRAARKGRIEVARYAPAATSHGSPKPVWRLKVARPS